MKHLLHLDLSETSLGGFLLRWIVPAAALFSGFRALTTGQMAVKGAEVTGGTAQLYGAAFVVLGIALIGRPTLSAYQSGSISKASVMRLSVGMVLFGLLMIAATVNLF